jgi:hypothetical protein
MTTEAKSNRKWKAGLSLAFRIYAGLCTLLVTAYLALVLWSIFFVKLSPIPVNGEANLLASYGAYVANESLKREGHLWRLAIALGIYSNEASVQSADVFKYLGKPDFVSGTAETGSLAYLYEHPNATNRWAVFAVLKDGKLTQIGFNDASTIDHLAYQPYLAP